MTKAVEPMSGEPVGETAPDHILSRHGQMTLPSRIGIAILVAAVTSLTLALRVQLPILVLGSGGDDLLFARAAASLSSGHWLGPPDYLTLSKGPSYPALIASTQQLHVPLKIAEQLTFLTAAGVLAFRIAALLRRPAFGIVTFVGLAFVPDNFGVMNSWVLRDGWYASLSLLVPIMFFLTLRTVGRARTLGWPLVLASFTGFAAAAFWLCREEGMWIFSLTRPHRTIIPDPACAATFMGATPCSPVVASDPWSPKL